ncbi:hypothetical protein HDU67_006691 [Dinochytrium kinnereticum]|nr:hypothetical protein HDU67_006691 [Dinochytrium kinnereticum]
MRDPPAVISASLLLLLLAKAVSAAPCKVGSITNSCYDTAVANGITLDQFLSFNPGLNCNTVQAAQKVCVSAGELPPSGPVANSDGTCAVYTIVSGDYCYLIGTKNSITTDQLTAFNPGLDCNTIAAGQRLCVSPGTLPPPPGPPGPRPDGSCSPYTVVSGDYCALIATKFPITVEQIEAVNVNTYKWKGCANLQAGMNICVSSGTPPAPAVNPNLQCGPESPGNKTCVLNACCSAYGFCGTTSEFCGPAPNGEPCISNCFIPTLPQSCSAPLKRKTGYYASWGARRKCNPVGVSLLDLKGYTHVFFSFAVMDRSYNIQFDNPQDVDLARQLVAAKAQYPGLKVVIAIGGWAFSQDEPTRSLFSEMIATQQNRATFISSSVNFMQTHGFDGLDIDFEYPASIERAGPPDDTPNLSKFFVETRAALGSRFELTIATPAGFWFLKGFDMGVIGKNVDMINMMSYDYHGPWDATLASSKPLAMPQTAMQDITDSLLLYIRAGVELSKINLGLAWYGRTYKLEDANCKGYGCKMTGGGAPGQCTEASGMLGLFEILDILGRNGISSNYDRATQTKWFNYNGELVTYDDEETWNAKTDFAIKNCLGGSMVWAIDLAIPKNGAVPGPAIALAVTSGGNGVWESPKSHECVAYGKRRYSSRLWDIKGEWNAACRGAGITIDGKFLSRPDRCIDLGIGGMWGEWDVSVDSCKPNWGSLSGADGCVEFGKKQYWARLWNIEGGADWGKMCRSTPSEFGLPYRCESQGFWGGEIGVWRVDDASCTGTWEDVSDQGCSEFGFRRYSAKLYDIIGDWRSGCENRQHTVRDVYFEKPTYCDQSIFGIWGKFDVPDQTCGEPPCPGTKSWDSFNQVCRECSQPNSIPPPPRDELMERRVARRSFDSLHSSLTVLNRTEAVSTKPGAGQVRLSKRGQCNIFWVPNLTVPQFQLGNQFNGAPEGPSGREILEEPRVVEQFRQLYFASNNINGNPNLVQERGGWIYADMDNPRRIQVVVAPPSRSSIAHDINAVGNFAINLNDPLAPGIPARWVLVANFHTHPGTTGAPEPSQADMTNAWYRGVPGFVISTNGIYVYGPERRAVMRAPRFYPNVADGAGNRYELVRSLAMKSRVFQVRMCQTTLMSVFLSPASSSSPTIPICRSPVLYLLISREGPPHLTTIITCAADYNKTSMAAAPSSAPAALAPAAPAAPVTSVAAPVAPYET